LAQRSGLPSYAGDLVGMLGYDEAAAIRALRHADPVSSFRTTVAQTPSGSIVFHNGDTLGFGTFVALLPGRDVGVIVLSNEGNVGLPDALGMWALDRLLEHPVVDHVADALKGAKEQFASFDKLFARPASPRPFPPLAPLAGRVTSPSFGKGVLRAE